ncbi:hypothetical protein QLX67_00985 [Balneolaceae bacterium ANBcel3]|nr:hypothetical protein [Balneolaceae bacterium ANBcel3]
MSRFIKWILLIDVALVLLFGLPAWLYSGLDLLLPLLLSFAITSVLAIVSFIPFTRIKKSSMNAYLLAIMGGMLMRMFFIGASLVVVILFTTLNKVTFTVGLLFSYIFKSVLETYILTRNVK